jgi:vacuolar-type H+-ATPase subunit I/STV1
MADFKKVLTPFVGLVTLLLGLFGGVLNRIAPPDTTGLAIAVGMVPFLVMLVFLLATAVSGGISTKRSRKMWLVAGIVMAVLCVPAVFVYPNALGRYTYMPDGHGSTRKIHAAEEYLTSAAQDYIRQNPQDASPSQLSRNFESDDMVWEKRGMEIAQTRLLGAYAWLVVTLCGAIFCFVQAIGAQKTSAGTSSKKGP